MNIDPIHIPTPCYVCDEGELERNLKILDSVQRRTGCRILLALKGFALFALFPLIRKYLSGVSASSLDEARLGAEAFGREVHLCAPAYRESEFDQLLDDNPREIELRPMTKFPVIRDLVVDRARIFASLKKIKAWIPVDSYLDMGPGPRQSQENQELAYVLSKCMSCGCCLEACPQYLKIELRPREGETGEALEARRRAAFDRAFMGAAAIAQIDLFDTNPIGRMNLRDRLDALIAQGGIQVCGNAQNCVRVCPKEIPLTTSIARQGRAATFHVLKKWFDR